MKTADWMASLDRYTAGTGFDFGGIDFMQLLGDLDQGVLITDAEGIIVFYNETMAKIDDLDPSDALGRKISDVYEYLNDSSMCMRCIKHQRPIVNYSLSYRSKNTSAFNTIESVFPLFKNGRLVGTFCICKDFNMIERTIPSFLNREKKRILGDGTRYTFEDIIGGTHEIRQAVKLAKMGAKSPSPIMLFGETGTGKELFAQAIHNYGDRADRQFIAINCAAIPENLLEGILFGTTKGAFTGAMDKAGLFEKAGGGTLYLDEVNSMPIGLQVKMLRAIQEKKIRRVGSVDEIGSDAKIISSLNREPQESIKEGLLRIDLFYRLGVVYIRIPPLRERRLDIEELTRHFIHKSAKSQGKRVKAVSGGVMDFFWRYHWPGNVRELEHIIEGAISIAGDTSTIRRKHLPSHLLGHLGGGAAAAYTASTAAEWSPPPGTRPPMANTAGHRRYDLDKETIAQAIQMAPSLSEAARQLGISRQLLNYKIKKFGLKPSTG